MPIEDQPEWIRNLYRDIYPQAPIYSVGPRTRVSGWRGANVGQLRGQRPNTFSNIRGDLPINIGNTGTGGLRPPVNTAAINPWRTEVTPETPPTPPTTFPELSLGNPGFAVPPSSNPPRVMPPSSIFDMINQIRTRNLNRLGPGGWRGMTGPSGGVGDNPIRRDVAVSDGFNNLQGAVPSLDARRGMNPLNYRDILQYLLGGRSQTMID